MANVADSIAADLQFDQTGARLGPSPSGNSQSLFESTRYAKSGTATPSRVHEIR
jgi:hypothetical protein